MEMTATLGLNFEMQHWLVANEALFGCFVSMSFSGASLERVGRKGGC